MTHAIVSRPSSVSRTSLYAVWLSWARCLLALAVGLVSAALLLARLDKSGTVIRYGQFAPADDIIGFVYRDVERGLARRLPAPLPTLPVPASDTSSRGQRVVSRRTSGNIDLFLLEPGGMRQLTHFSDFSPARSERAARRANQYPIWSPNDSWIAFLSVDVNSRMSLYAVRPTGDDVRQLGSYIRIGESFFPRWVAFPAGLSLDIAGLLLLGVALFGRFRFFAVYKVLTRNR